MNIIKNQALSIVLALSTILAMQGCALVAVGPAVLQHQILPFLEQRGCAVPVERMLHHDDLVTDEQLLLTGDVDIEVRVALVQIVDGHTVQIANCLDQGRITTRLLERRVREQDQDFSFRHGLSLAEPLVSTPLSPVESSI